MLLAPVADKLAHVGLGSAEFLNLLFEGAQLFFGQLEHAMARSTAMVTRSENLGEFTKGKAKLECPLRKLYPPNRAGRIAAVATLCPFRLGQNPESLIMAERVGADPGQACKLSRSQGSRSHQTSMNP